MSAKIQHPSAGSVDPRYLDLIRAFVLRPIRDDEELERASTVASALAARDDLGEAEEDYLDVLATLIERYEAEHHPMAIATTPAEFLRDLLDESGMSASRLAAETGIEVSTLSELLNGKSSASPRDRKRLAAYFHVEESAFR